MTKKKDPRHALQGIERWEKKMMICARRQNEGSTT